MEIREALTFDDVLLVPAASSVLPSTADTRTRVTQIHRAQHPAAQLGDGYGDREPHGDCMAQAGGMGVVHRNLTVEEQAREVRRVKRFEAGIVYNPITLTPDQTLADAKALQERYRVTGFPVVDESGRVLGIVTNRDMRFASTTGRRCGDDDRRQSCDPAGACRSAMRRVSLMKARRIEKLLVTDAQGKLTGLLTLKDSEQAVLNPTACKDDLGRLRVAAATTVGDAGFERSRRWWMPASI